MFYLILMLFLALALPAVIATATLVFQVICSIWNHSTQYHHCEPASAKDAIRFRLVSDADNFRDSGAGPGVDIESVDFGLRPRR